MHDNPAVADCVPANYVAPVFEYDHSNANGGRSITGGMVYRGTTFPLLAGWYITADFITGNGWVLKRESSGSYTSNLQSNFPAQLAAFAEDNARELFALAYNGTIYQVNFAGILPVMLETFSAIAKDNLHVISWKTASERNVDRFVIELSSNGTDFTPFREIRATNRATGYTYTITSRIPYADDVHYRLKLIDRDASYKYSDVVRLKGRTDLPAFITPSFVTGGSVKIVLRKPFSRLELVDMNGRVIYSRHLGNDKKEIVLDVASFPKQVYIVRLQSKDEQIQQKIIIR
jgi:hypothetical protein